MAILEINIEKPALVEEYRSPDEMRERVAATGRDRSTSDDRSSGGSKGKVVAALAVLAGVAVLAWRLHSGGSDDGDDSPGDGEYDHGPEPEIGGDERGGVRGTVAGAVGLAVALASVVAAVRRVRR
ncbi:hypothetical protein [Halorussus halobius]|uniref:hypothetical protein n=1 Tax=Halorussus halobius TaxID=1710537 RepID=UPI001092F559|nr:hypothetical protein [Halorussus halobius]